MTVLIWATVAAAFFVSIIFYPKMPERMASHWNARGQADDTMNKSVALFLMPAVALGEVLLLYAIVRIDPLRKNIRRFYVYYEGFILLLAGFMLAIHLFMIAWNLGVRLSINALMPLAMGVLFFGMGALLPRLRPNWFIGIRTPWTLSNEAVWARTHAVGGVIFKAAAIAVLLGAVWPEQAIWFVLAPLLTASAVTVLYSLGVYFRLR